MKKQLLLLSSVFFLPLFIQAQSWTIQNSAFTLVGAYPADIAAADSMNVWAVAYDGSGTNVGIQEFTRTTNGGTLWTSGTVFADTNYRFSNIAALSGSTCYAMMFNNTAQSGGYIFKTTDGGMNWSKVDSGNIFTGASFPDFMYFWSDSVGFALGDPNGGYFEIYTTNDAGTTWTRVPQANIPTNLSGEYAITNDFDVQGNKIWAGTNKGRMLYSTDGGMNWSVVVVATAATTISTVSFLDDGMNGIAIGTNSTGAVTGKFKSTNGGVSWSTLVPSGTMFASDVVSIPGTHAFVSCGGNSTARGSSFSTSYGATWTLIDTAIGTGFNGYTEMDFYSTWAGWAGSFTASPTLDGMYKWVPGALGVSSTENSFGDVHISPNPTSGMVNYDFVTAKNSTLNFALTDLFGKKVFEKAFSTSAGKFHQSFDFSSLPSGMYFITLNSGLDSRTEKLIIH